MKIAIHGLGRMGMQIAESLVRDGHHVIVINRSPDKTDHAASFGATPAYSKQEVLERFEGEQPVVWIMLPAGDVFEHELHEWLDVLPEKSIIIDGGNSDFRTTKQHNEITTSRGSELVDVGTSGGVHGFDNGFSMMVGGSERGYKILEPALISLAKPHGGYQYFGESGSGHYVKMVHNAIEYGMMESLAEGYRMLKEGPYQNIDLVAAGEVWEKQSIIASNLNHLTAEGLRENPTLEGIDGFVSESGEARWTLEVAKDKNIELPSIQAAFDVRLRSQQGERSLATKLLALMRNKFGGHAINGDKQ